MNNTLTQAYFTRDLDPAFCKKVITQKWRWYKDQHGMRYVPVQFAMSKTNNVTVFANQFQILAMQSYFNLADWQMHVCNEHNLNQK